VTKTINEVEINEENPGSINNSKNESVNATIGKACLINDPDCEACQ